MAVKRCRELLGIDSQTVDAYARGRAVTTIHRPSPGGKLYCGSGELPDRITVHGFPEKGCCRFYRAYEYRARNSLSCVGTVIDYHGLRLSASAPTAAANASSMRTISNVIMRVTPSVTVEQPTRPLADL
jgi:hypothetical protein